MLNNVTRNVAGCYGGGGMISSEAIMLLSSFHCKQSEYSKYRVVGAAVCGAGFVVVLTVEQDCGSI